MIEPGAGAGAAADAEISLEPVVDGDVVDERAEAVEAIVRLKRKIAKEHEKLAELEESLADAVAARDALEGKV